MRPLEQYNSNTIATRVELNHRHVIFGGATFVFLPVAWLNTKHEITYEELKNAINNYSGIFFATLLEYKSTVGGYPTSKFGLAVLQDNLFELIDRPRFDAGQMLRYLAGLDNDLYTRNNNYPFHFVGTLNSCGFERNNMVDHLCEKIFVGGKEKNSPLLTNKNLFESVPNNAEDNLKSIEKTKKEWGF